MDVTEIAESILDQTYGIRASEFDRSELKEINELISTILEPAHATPSIGL